MIILMMMMAGLPVVRPESVEMSVWGVAGLAGLGAGGWSSREELDMMRGGTRVFTRQLETHNNLTQEYKQWLEACKRFTKWYS